MGKTCGLVSWLDLKALVAQSMLATLSPRSLVVLALTQFSCVRVSQKCSEYTVSRPVEGVTTPIDTLLFARLLGLALSSALAQAHLFHAGGIALPIAKGT